MEFGKKKDRNDSEKSAKFIDKKPIDSLAPMRQKMRDQVALDARTALKNIEKIYEGADHSVLAIQILSLKRRAFALIRIINDASEKELGEIAKKLSK